MNTPNKSMIISLLEKVYKEPIEDIEFEELKEFNTIAEYEFSIEKAKILYKDKEESEIYLKMIKGGKIKESIFCFWSLLYEEYLKNNKGNTVKKTIITQVTSDKNSSCIVLTLDAKLNYCAEINLIELKEFCKNNNQNERWSNNLEIKDEEILFLGKKLF